MTVTINIITEEPDGTERLIIQKRNPAKVMHCWQKWQAAAAGMVSMQPDASSPIPNPLFVAAVHEVKQETRLIVGEEEIIFLALVREIRFFEVGLLGEVRVRRSHRSLLGDIDDPFESEGFFAVPFTPGDFADFLARIGRHELGASDKAPDRGGQLKAGVKAYTPMGLAAALISLVHSCGSARVVEEAFGK